METKIYSIVYDKNQIVEYEKYDNSHIKTIEQRSYLFEINPILDIVDNHNITEEYLGIFSYKFPQKTGIFKKKLEWLLNKNPDFDVYGLCDQRLKGKYLQFSDKVHLNFLKLFIPLCKDLGLNPIEPNFVIYSNYFICKTEIYRQFVEEIIKPAVYLLETKYKDLAWKDSHYKGLSKDQLKLYTGLDYYPMFTFVLERLLNMYINNNKFKFKQLT